MAFSRTGALFLAFAGMGSTASLIPASLPTLAADLGLPTADVLGAIPGLFAGLLCGVLLAPILVRATSAALSVRSGALGQLLGLLVILFAPGPGFIVAGAVIAGIGFGLVEASGTVLARQYAAADLTRLLSLLLATSAIAAATGPLLVVAAGAFGIGRFVLGIAVLVHLAAAIVVSPAPASAVAPPARARAVAPHLIPLAIGLFCYVGVETVLAGWSAVTIERELGATASIAALGTSAFWVLMTAGRLLGARALRRFPAPGMVLVCVSAIAVSLVAAVLLSPLSVVAGLSALGIAVLFCGPCYGLFIGTAVGAVQDSIAPTVTASLIATGALGGLAIPLIATAQFGERSNLWVAASFAVLAVVVILVFGSLRRRQAALPK